MDAIPIPFPSPSAFLKSPTLKPTVPPPTAIKPAKSAPKRPSTAPKASSGSNTAGAGISKPKQSKSRNGCITCKTKRLKCDETKPKCQQCQKRNVECGGYKKDFKWRPFEETVLATKSPTKQRKGSNTFEEQDGRKKNSQQRDVASGFSPSASGDGVNFPARRSPSLSDASGSTPGSDPLGLQSSPVKVHSGSTFHQASFPPQLLPHRPYSQSQASIPPTPLTRSIHPSPPLPDIPPGPFAQMPNVSEAPFSNSYNPTDALQFPPRSNPAPLLPDNIPPDPGQTSADDQFVDEAMISAPTARPGYSSGQSPRLIDLLSPGSYMGPNPEYPEFRPPHSPVPYQPSGYTPPPFAIDEDDEDVEEIIRQDDPLAEPWAMRAPSPALSTSSSSSDGSVSLMFQQPTLSHDSPEMLMLRFDRQTCGILSVKDGPTENPWRTLVWPLAQDSAALYHAISCMTAFHSSKEDPQMRMAGVDHMRRSIRALAMGIENMRVDSALATTLALAFSESWDQHVSTGIQHLRGAKALVNQALVRHQQSSMSAEDITRLRFLFNTWKYMDVIARLTSVDEESSDDFEALMEPLLGPSGHINEVDPLMGCASTLFPLIGRAARLIQQVRKTESNSVGLISQAIEVKQLIEQWEAPQLFEPPEDPTSEVQHSIQTAEAYRWATLLYLHQAVPEIPSLPASQLAKKVLVLLATVPLSSRTTIVQIYPLLAASCEAASEDDRRWVEDRWAAMQRRLMIGNIDRCLEVVKEVWYRRDNFELEKQAREQKRLTRIGSVGPPMAGGKRKWARNDFDDLYQFLETETNDHKRHASIGDMGMPTPSKASVHKRPIDKLENIEYEMTVRGSMHWIGVMKDWNWEVLLG